MSCRVGCDSETKQYTVIVFELHLIVEGVRNRTKAQQGTTTMEYSPLGILKALCYAANSLTSLQTFCLYVWRRHIPSRISYNNPIIRF